MSFLIQKREGGARTCFFQHEGKRVTPTKSGVVVDTRPPDHVFGDPWLSVSELTADAAESHRKRIASEEKSRRAAQSEREKADEDAKTRRAALTAKGLRARTTADLDRSLAQVLAETEAVKAALKANPDREASATKRLKRLAAQAKSLEAAGAKSAQSKPEAKPDPDAKAKPKKSAQSKPEGDE